MRVCTAMYVKCMNSPHVHYTCVMVISKLLACTLDRELKVTIFFKSQIVLFWFLQKRLRMVSVLGAGLLVGTALAVIIPEGVHALYEQTHDHGHSHGKWYPGPRGFLSP